jgi:hypothetical protein
MSRLIRNLRRLEGFLGCRISSFSRALTTIHPSLLLRSTLLAVRLGGGRGGGREREEEEEEEEGLKLLRRPNYVGLNSVQWTPRAFLPFFLHNNLTHPMTPTLTPATTLALTLSALALTP